MHTTAPLICSSGFPPPDHAREHDARHSVGATMGMRKARRREIAHELVEIARERGSEVIGGSNAEVAAHLEADVRLGPDSPRLLARRASRSSRKPSSQGRG